MVLHTTERNHLKNIDPVEEVKTNTTLKPILNQSNPSATSSSNSLLPNKRRARDVRQPRSILDREELLKALQKANVQLKPKQLESFYQQLHRQHYPRLSDFVRNYHENAKGDASTNNKRESGTAVANEKGEPRIRKKKNLVQFPKAFLKFLESHDYDSDQYQENMSKMENEYTLLSQIPPFSTVTSHVSHHATSANGDTTKLAVTLQGNHSKYNTTSPSVETQESFTVETVIMRHAGSRITLCVSSQVGCAMGCTFCATGTMGIRGNLNAGEILEQVVHAERFLRENADFDNQFHAKKLQMIEEAEARMETDKEKKIHNARKKYVNPNALSRVRNIVFMGMGEPLNNYKNVIAACNGLMDRRRWNLAYDRITVSTVGVTPKMRKLTEDLPQVNLALSLHAPNQEMRESIVPTAKRYPIEGIIDAMDNHMRGGRSLEKLTEEELKAEIGAGRRKAMVEYVMLTGPTSTFEAAHELGKLCENRNLVVNLIPYNQTDVKDKLSCPSHEHMKKFQDIVTSYGCFCFIRRTMGADIAGACGQLVVEKQNDQSDNRDVDIEDFVGGKSKITNSKEKNTGSVVSFKKTSLSDSNIDVASSGKNGKNDAVVDENKNEIESAYLNYKKSTDLDKWIAPLAAATGIAATSLIVSSTLLMMHKYRR